MNQIKQERRNEDDINTNGSSYGGSNGGLYLIIYRLITQREGKEMKKLQLKTEIYGVIAMMLI